MAVCAYVPALFITPKEYIDNQQPVEEEVIS